jgi:thiamine biosynthesis protein ThiS
MIVVNNRDQVEHSAGMTVQDILKKLGYTYTLITVTVNGKLVPREQYDEYTVDDGSEVGIFHLAHGG